MVRERNKLGRYEKGASYTDFKLLANGNVRYLWGMTGFQANGEREMPRIDAENAIAGLVAEGYVLTEEVPISESDGCYGDNLLDWVGGITR